MQNTTAVSESVLPCPHRPLLSLTAAWTASGTAVLLAATLTAPAVLLLACIAPVTWQLLSGTRRLWHIPSRVFAVLYLAAGYLTCNAMWAPDPLAAAWIVATVWLFISAVDLTLFALQKIDTRVLRAMAIGFISGYFMGGLYLSFEILSRQLIRRTLAAFIPWMQPKPLHTFVGPDGTILFEPHLLNYNMTVVTMLIWPALLTFKYLRITLPIRLMLGVGFMPPLAAILRSEHASSKLALVGGAATFLICHIRPAFARRLIMGCWIIATLLVVPITSAFFAAHLYTAPWLFKSAQKRVVIWGYTSQRVTNAPMLGVGMAATRVSHRTEGGPDAPLAPGSALPLETGWHSHNMFLQAWYETGAVGAALLLALGVLIVRSFARAADAAQPFLLSAFATFMLVGSSSFSLWAPWFMASFGLVAIFSVLATTVPQRFEPPANIL